MQELDDNALLREYVERGSGEAFAAIVTRHVNKVYSVALRHTRNVHQAEEITQAVFVILARKSRHLGRRVILSGWLYQTARLTALTFIRSEIRRARREQEAYMQTSSNENEPNSWTQIAPLLDAAMADLNETDRHAVVLRFFDGGSMREVGAVLGVNEDAAKKRVNRAVERLQNFFHRRGITSTTAAITEAISAHSVQVAPVALAKSVTAAALARGATASGSTLTLIKGALKVMAWSKAKTTVVVSVAALLVGGTTVIVSASKAREARAKDFVSYEVLQPSWMQKVFHPHPSESELKKQVVGVWALVTLRPRASTNYVYMKNNKSIKTRTPTDWSLVTYDANSNILGSASGPYTIKSGVYSEKIETATGYMAQFLGGTGRFKICVADDKFYQLGIGGNYIHEMWKRVP
jgi:RNA polymerase sigma factor (sigma-70 family)